MQLTDHNTQNVDFTPRTDFEKTELREFIENVEGLPQYVYLFHREDHTETGTFAWLAFY